MKEWHFFEKVYRRWVVLMIGDFQKLYDDLGDFGYTGLDELATCKGMCIDLNKDNNTVGQSCTVIWMPVYETATLVHEIAHLVMISFDQVGIPIALGNTEAFAFYSEYWFNEFQRARRKHPNGRSPAIARL